MLVNPGIHISTRDAYNNCTPARPANSLEELIRLHPLEWKESITNDFEQYVFKLYPEIEDIKISLYRAGALYSSMSGSGSTVYGIFSGRKEIPGRIMQQVIFEGDL